LPYELIVDEQPKPLEDARYLLSPGDLYALHQVPEIVQIGISTLKIEGRYKDAKYVALTTHAYRKAVDEAWAGQQLSISRAEEIQLEQVYSRGLGPYFIGGTNHQAVVQGRSPRHRGVLMGRVARVLPESVLVAPDLATSAAPLKAGDGIVFDAANWRSPEADEEGGRVYQVVPARGGQLELRFGNGTINTTRIRAGDLVWRTHDPDLEKATRPFTQASAPVHKQPLHVLVTAHEGAPLVVEWTLVEQPQIKTIVRSDEPLGSAQNRATTADAVREQLGRLGNTPYALAGMDLDLAGRPFVPSSLLNNLRRQAVEQLVERQSLPPVVTVHEPVATLEAMLARVERTTVADETATPQLHLLVRTPEQLEAAIDLRPASITLDYLELYGLRPAVEQVQARGITARVASPRILKPNEQRVVRFLLKLDCEILVRSTGLLYALQAAGHPPLIGDFSLNAANVLSADTFLRLGLTRFTPTHDLNAAQIADLARQIGAHKLEVVAYHHLAVFHTEHCVFCRFLSEGTSFKDCGHPCEKNRVALRDINGREHPVMADVGCRNTVFGGEAQAASRHLDRWQAAGIQHFRLEFVHETGAQVTQIARAFAETLAGAQSTRDLAQQLQRLAPQGTTEGSLFVPDTYLTLPVLQ
jgi:putative protease